MFTYCQGRFNGGVLFHRLFVLISTVCSGFVMAVRRMDSFKRFMDRIRNWASPQPSNNNANSTSNNQNNGQSGNISGNSTSRPPEGEQHSVAILTTTTTNNTNNCKHNCNNVSAEEHLAEVLVMPVNDTKAITATTTAAVIERPTVAEATKSRANTTDESHEAGINSWNCGNAANAATTASEANTMVGVRSTAATAPIAQEEDDAEEVWYSGEEDGDHDVELAEKQRESCCCLVNDNEQCCQVDIDLNINSVTITAATTEKPMQRSKSRVRTYLKRCRDRLTGQHQQAVANATNSTAATTTTVSKTYVQDEKCQESIGVEVSSTARSPSTQQFSALEEKKDEETEAEGAYEEVENKACTTTLIATTERQVGAVAHTLFSPIAMVVEDERTAGEEASLELDEEAHLTSEQSVLAYDDIEFSLPSPSVLMDSGSSNVSADQQQQQHPTLLTSAKHKRDALTLAAAEVEVQVDDSADLTVEQETRQMQQKCQQQQQIQSGSLQTGKLKCSTVAADGGRGKLLQQQTQQQQSLMSISTSCPPLVKEEQLAFAIHMDSGTAALIDKHLAAIYPVYMACTRSILIRQARDLLVCSYLGCLQSFEMEFLCKFAEIAAELRQRHAVGVNVLWRKGWPLTTPTGEVILHLGALDDALVRPSDLYLCVKSVDKSETPQLHVVWRNASNGLQIQQQQALQSHASVTATFATCDTAAAATTIQSHCIDFNATTTTTAIATTPPTHLSALTLEMLTSDELPQLLQHLLVGVEHSIERVSLNELQMPASTTAATAAPGPLASDEANNNGKSNNNNKSSSGGSATNSSLMRCSNNNTTTNSPKCALRRSELITKNKVLNNKFMLRRLTNRQDSMNSTSSGQSCGSSGSTSSDELLHCNGSHHTSYNNNNNNNNNITSPSGTANTVDPLKMSAGSTNSASTSPALPLFCLGNSFPHIDSDEENTDEKRSAHGEDQFECEIVPPASIGEIPEKLLTTSGIYLPGTTDLNGHPIVTVDAECVLAAGLNCYEIATVLLYYSTIPERTLTVNANDRTTTQQQQQPSMQQQIQHSHEESQAEPAFINRPSTPKMASAATLASGNSTSVSVTSNVPTATVAAAKSPAHAIADSSNAINSNDSGNSGSHGAATPTFTILIAIEKSGQMCVIDLICQSLRLLTRQIAYCEILAVCLEHNLLLEQQQQSQQQQLSAFGNNTAVSSCANGENNESCIKEQQQQAAATQQKQHSLKFISVNEVTTSVAPSQIPYGKLQGLHHHDARKWREFFVALEPFQRQCATAGQRLVAVMSDIGSADLQGLPTRRQLYAQHRALSRALMDSELHNLRKRGALQLARLQELAKLFALVAATTTDAGENSHNHNGNIYGSSSGAGGAGNNNRHSSSNKLLSTISSISHLGFGGSYNFSMTHQQQQQQTSQNRPAALKYSSMTSCDAIRRPTVAANATAANNAVAVDNCSTAGNANVAIRLHKVTLLFNEVDRAAKRLEQLTEQRRERLRELTRQRALEDEINENWRHVYKALILLEYLIKTGTEKVVQQCKVNIFAIQILREFVYFEAS
ncbi:serine-rich adhesin for platelets-like isoform X1 [Bactrocera oleae]|uniref:serine-rich adhesin for platelets-like isoform X1 n=2 Tax=Bactrocera oleae TaxID=104688 RepID=UPI00387E56D0